MKLLRFLRLPLASLFIFSMVGIAADEPDPGQVLISVGRLLERGHFSQQRLDDKVSARFLKNYLEGLDYYRLYFTQKDIDGFNTEYATKLDDDVLLGNPDPAFAIYNLYKKRVETRVARVKELLKKEYKFDSNRTIEIDRKNAPWPKDEAELERLWRDRLEGELLQETLNKHAIKPPVEVLTRRYDQLLRNLNEQTKEDVVKIFLSVLSQTYDPHSEYMSRSELENFSINMRLSLVGIGAVLNSEEGYAKIMELVPGGPASKDGRLKVGDRVTAVAQGEKDFVDAVDMKLDKVVEMIRGKKNTVVRLQVFPATATDPSVRKVIEITREEIKLKDQEAKAEIIERPGTDGRVQRLGWIVLPSFYADMEKSGAAGAKSTTKDVLALINRLKQEKVEGIVMDLRRDGGGSLEEAVNLTGLFIKQGPVVQARDSNGSITISKDRDASVAWDGPLIVCTNRLSASASEIFAAALQDYNRAVIVGDQNTFGKGTVQTMLEIGRIMPFLGGGTNQAGALKLTIQKFYRIAGGSTQLRGVESDIKLPSLYDSTAIGESALKGPLPYDTVEPLEFAKLDRPLFKPELKQRSAARVALDTEFRYLTEDFEKARARLAENTISLNKEARQKEIDEEKANKEARDAARAKVAQPEQKAYALPLDAVNKPELELVKVEKKTAAAAEKPEAKDGAIDAAAVAKAHATVAKGDAEGDDDEDAEAKKTGRDPVKNEALNILSDLIHLQRGSPKKETASTVPAK
jgi:carboxyl-terminal processing protease